MKKNNKAFTLIELIATITILSVVILIATISYTKIRRSVLNNQYKNVKSLIESNAVKYSAKNGYYAFFVQELIDDGLLEPDDENNVYDPRDNSVLNCHIVMVAEDANGNLSAKLQTEDHRESGTCKYTDIDVYPSKLKITAKVSGTSINYTPTSNVRINTSDVFPLISDGWTNRSLDLKCDASGITEDITGSRIVWNKNTDNIKIYPDINYTTSEYGVYNDYYYLDFYTPADNQYQAKLKYKFDNEKPVIYADKTKLAKATPNTDWHQSKSVIMYVSDKDGVGLDRVYVGSRPCTDMLTDKNLGQAAIPGLYQVYQFRENINGTGINANVCAVDKLGNIAESGKVLIKNVDNINPTCTINEPAQDGENGWHKAQFDVTFSYTDPGTYASSVIKHGFAKTSNPAYNADTAYTQSANTDKNGQNYYGKVEDKAGNIGTCNKNVKKDNVNPTCSLATTANPTGENNWYKAAITVNLTKGDAHSGVKYYGTIDSSTVNYNSKTQFVQNDDRKAFTVYGYVKDEAGNTASCSKGGLKKDTVGPTCTFEVTSGTKGNGNWYVSNVDFKTNNADATSGVNGYTITTSSTTSPTYNSTNTWTITNDTLSTGRSYYCYVRDEAGNKGSNSIIYYKDTIAPTCTVSPTGTQSAVLDSKTWFKSDVLVNLTTNDPKHGSNESSSGVQNYNVSLSSNDLSQKKSSLTYNSDTTSSGRSVYGTVQDAAGNKGYCDTKVYRDTTAPNILTIENTHGNGWCNRGCIDNDEMKLVTTVVEDGVGVQFYDYSDNLVDFWERENTSATQTTSLPYHAERYGNTYVRVCDRLNNCDIKPYFAMIDGTAPTDFGFTYTGELVEVGRPDYYNSPVNPVFYFYCADNLSGVSHTDIYYRNKTTGETLGGAGGSRNPEHPYYTDIGPFPNGEHNLREFCTDYAGNTANADWDINIISRSSSSSGSPGISGSGAPTGGGYTCKRYVDRTYDVDHCTSNGYTPVLDASDRCVAENSPGGGGYKKSNGCEYSNTETRFPASKRQAVGSGVGLSCDSNSRIITVDGVNYHVDNGDVEDKKYFRGYRCTKINCYLGSYCNTTPGYVSSVVCCDNR